MIVLRSVWKSQVDLQFASSWRWHHPSGLQLCSCPHRFASWRDLLSTSHVAKSAGDFDLPAKVMEVALPVVGCEASEVLWGSAFWLGMQGQYHFQSAELDLGNTNLPVALESIWMHRQRVACCVPCRKQLLKISWLVWTFTACASFPRKAMNSRQQCLWYYIRYSTIANPLLYISPYVFIHCHGKDLSSKQCEGLCSIGFEQHNCLMVQFIKLR